MSVWAKGNTIELLKQKLKSETTISDKDNSQQAPDESATKACSNTNTEAAGKPPVATTAVASSGKKKNKKNAGGRASKNSAPTIASDEEDGKKAQPQGPGVSSSRGGKEDSNAREGPVILPDDLAELEVGAFTFVGTVDAPDVGTSAKAKESLLSAAIMAPEFVPQRRYQTVLNRTLGNGTQRVSGTTTNAYPMHHHYQRQKQPQQAVFSQPAKMQRQGQPSWGSCYYDQQYHNAHHYQQQLQPPDGQTGCTMGKVYQDVYNPVEYDMSQCTAPLYPRMYNRYPGMCMDVSMLPNMNDFSGLCLQQRLPYFPQQQSGPNSYKPLHVGRQQPWMRNGNSGTADVRKGNSTGQWFPPVPGGFDDAINAWKQHQKGGA